MPLARKVCLSFCLLLGVGWCLNALGQPACADDPVQPAPTMLPAPKSLTPAAPETEPAVQEEVLAPAAVGTDSWGLWVEADTLVWFLKPGPLPSPLLAAGNPRDPIPGALGQPGTKILLGQSNLDYGTFPGIRWSVGKWIDADQTLALECNGFWLDTEMFHFQAGGDTAGNPPLYVPVFRANLGREGSFVISDPVSVLTGSVFVDSQSRLWGVELNGRYKYWQDDRWEVQLLAGFRYLELDESLRFTAYLRDPVLDVNEKLFDQFDTKSQFFGTQIGSRTRFRLDRWSADLTGKLAVGYCREFVGIGGAVNQTGSGVPRPGVFQGGLFSQPTNLGRVASSDLAVVPELDFKVSFEPVQRLELFAGYSFLYWSRVVRPGNQIDRSLNQTQQAGGVLFGPARPAPLFQRSDFFAHGLNVGLAFRY